MSRLIFLTLVTLLLSAVSVFAIPAPTLNTTNLSTRSGSSRPLKITYFYQGGAAGACGDYNDDSTPLVALPPSLYQDGAHCGKSVMLCKKNWVDCKWAIVADECPGCGDNGDDGDLHLDCSKGLYDHFGSEDAGVLYGEVWAGFSLFW